IIVIQLDQFIVDTSSCTSQNYINSPGIAGAVLQHRVNQTVFSNWRSDVGYGNRIGFVDTTRRTLSSYIIGSWLTHFPFNFISQYSHLDWSQGMFFSVKVQGIGSIKNFLFDKQRTACVFQNQGVKMMWAVRQLNSKLCNTTHTT